MRNAVSSLKQYSACGGLRANGSPLSFFAFFILHFALTPSSFSLPSSPAVVRCTSSVSDLSLPGRPSPEHLRLFTPKGAPPASYQVSLLAEPMEAARTEVMRVLGVGAARADGGGPWSVRRLEVAEAFGGSGPYDYSRLARLFNGRRAQVARGPVLREGSAVASVTLISPYPDPSFSRLEPGTMAILLDLRQAQSR